MDRHGGILQRLGIVHGEGQRRRRGAHGQAVQGHIAQGDLAVLILVRGIVGAEAHVRQRQGLAVVLDGHQAVGRRILSGGHHVHRQGLLVVGENHVGSNRLLFRLGHGGGGLGGGLDVGAVQAAHNRLRGILAVAVVKVLDLVRAQLHRLGGKGLGRHRHIVGAVLRVVINGGKDGSGPHVRAHIAHALGHPTGAGHEGHAVDLVGFAGEVGEVQHQLLVLFGRGHGAEHIVAIAREIEAEVTQIGLVQAKACSPAVAVRIQEHVRHCPAPGRIQQWYHPRRPHPHPSSWCPEK